jgi:hypothetical protein
MYTFWCRGAALNLRTSLLLLPALACSAAAQTSDTSNELWPEFDFYIKLNDSSRIFLLYSATRQQDLNTYAEGQLGAHIDFWALPPLRRHLNKSSDASRAKLMMVRIGYLYSAPNPNSGGSTEHMPTAEATARFPLSQGWLLSDRNRIDLRWVDGDPSQRYRNRLKVERTYDLGRFQLTPYTYAEAFYSFESRSWTRLRYAAGAEWNITRRIVLEGYYLRQNTWSATPQFVNAIGIAVQLYFR